MESRFALEPLEMGAAGVGVVGLHVELLEDAFIPHQVTSRGGKKPVGTCRRRHSSRCQEACFSAWFSNACRLPRRVSIAGCPLRNAHFSRCCYQMSDTRILKGFWKMATISRPRLPESPRKNLEKSENSYQKRRVVPEYQ